MPLEPYDWNVVVAGAWNLAILTPEGINRRILEQPAGTPVEVEIPLDRQAPIRVKAQDVMILAAPGHLVIAPTTFDPGGIRRAGDFAIRGVSSLQETPFTAAGVNIRYKAEVCPDELLECFASPLDNRLADIGLTTVTKDIKRSVPHRNGILNIELRQLENGAIAVHFNFHRSSTLYVDLTEWLSTTDEMTAQAERLKEPLAGRPVTTEDDLTKLKNRLKNNGPLVKSLRIPKDA